MKSIPKPVTSLQHYFRRQAIRWASIGFLLTALFAIPCVLYSAKVSSERQLLVAAKSAARAFRPMILQENIRDAQFQMRKALDLKPGESAIVRSPDLTPIYPIEESDKTSHCAQSGKSCWGRGFSQVSLLYPIYFDEQKKKNLFGYLELSLHPTFDLMILSVLFLLLVAAFIVQTFGLTWALTESGEKIVSQLTTWADHLRETPAVRPQFIAPVPFAELYSMQLAVGGLYLEIERLREKSAAEARIEAQFALLREISHDLKTPLSLLAKYFWLVVDTVEHTGKLDPVEIKNVERTLKRMGEIIRQVCAVPFNQLLGVTPTSVEEKKVHVCDLAKETKTILDDFFKDDEVQNKNIKFNLALDDMGSSTATISVTSYYRIVMNLLKNAVEAVPSETGEITVSTMKMGDHLAVVIEDNGPGIEPKLFDKIFDFEFTTKPSRGTGLGLGIVSKICKEFRATLLVENNPAGGSRFTVLFYAAAASGGAISQEVQQNVAI